MVHVRCREVSRVFWPFIPSDNIVAFYCYFNFVCFIVLLLINKYILIPIVVLKEIQHIKELNESCCPGGGLPGGPAVLKEHHHHHHVPTAHWDASFTDLDRENKTALIH